jgi:hypothetical protein
MQYDISQVDISPIGSYVKRDYVKISVNLQNKSSEWALIEREKNSYNLSVFRGKLIL